MLRTFTIIVLLFSISLFPIIDPRLLTFRRGFFVSLCLIWFRIFDTVEYL